MPDTNELKGLFAALARSRPEWVAQGLLKYALTLPEVWKLFAPRLGAKTSGSTVVVKEEVPGDDGWRADLHLTQGDAKYRIELKVGALFTRRQHEAVMDAIVLPKVRSTDAKLAGFVRDGDSRRVFTWAEVAAAASKHDPALGALLAEVDTFTAPWATVTEVPASIVDEELAALASEGSWRNLYLWLCALDQSLSERVAGYAPGSWSTSKRRPYYGFHFTVADGEPGSAAKAQTYWAGFAKRNGSPTFECWRNSHHEGEVIIQDEKFTISGALERILSHQARSLPTR